MTELDFSIVVPVFNAEPFLERCLRSLIQQTYPADRYEIIVVDNNSSDRSAAITAKFHPVKLLHEAEQGSYAARNTGVRAARGEVVAFTDPDCEVQADWLENIYRAIEHSEVGIVLGDRQFGGDADVLGMLAAYESSVGARIFTTQKVDCYYAYTNNMAVRMSLLKFLGGFRHLQRGADTLFLKAAVAREGPSTVHYAADVVVRHLEISRVADYLRKKGIYGRVDGKRGVANRRALPLAERVELALRINREFGVSIATNIGFLGSLAAGAVRFEWEMRRP
jgi:glycosyltransferase involved in cell wall biosynthesis